MGQGTPREAALSSPTAQGPSQEGTLSQQGIRQFFQPVRTPDRKRHLHREFRRLRRLAPRARATRTPQHWLERPELLRTQNVRGLRKDQANLAFWFGEFRAKDKGVAPALTLLQETHVQQSEICSMAAKHRAAWGCTSTAGPLSYWSGSNRRAGGVAILINPYAQVSDIQPVMEELWSAHFMALSMTVNGMTMTVINIYAPSIPNAREHFFRTLCGGRLPPDGMVIVGGDFNCSEDLQLDRSLHHSSTTHWSAGMKTLRLHWGIMDALSDVMQQVDDGGSAQDFHATHHTYHYHVRQQYGSSRLDRWYIDSAHYSWVRSVATMNMGTLSDHASVVLSVSDPANRPRVRVQPRLYPTRRSATQAVQAAYDTLHDKLQAVFEEWDATGAPATQYVDAWEAHKKAIREVTRSITTEALRATKRGYQQRVRRLRISLVGLPRGDHDARSKHEAAIGQQLSLLRRRGARHTLGALAWPRGVESKAFYARIASSRGRASIASLTPSAGAPNRNRYDLANIMADAWAPVMTYQQCPLSEGSWTHHSVSLPEELLPLDAPFTHAEVDKAIKRCQRTKSGGPDLLPNAWYRDNAQLLGPILWSLFNACYRDDAVPVSFAEANIACLKKSGNATDPLGYRPIALLNSDYKVYARMLATRLQCSLSRLVDTAQNGFVPGRNIHTTLDWFHEAQATARETQSDAIAILLDIKKAYDSVHRPFLAHCLTQQGFPPRFRQAIERAHDGTTARFLVNGNRSDPIPVTQGLRQGCPLAPLLFVLVLDSLYTAIKADTALRGVRVGSLDEPLVVAGYADDTAGYLADVSQLPRFMALIERFGTHSGLHVNHQKSVIFRLAGGEGAPLPQDMMSLSGSERCRYLGIQVGPQPQHEHAWVLCKQQLLTRLCMAQLKTHSVRQRAVICQAIIIPKLLYVARHHWPTMDIINDMDRRIHSFVWEGVFDKTLVYMPRRAWLSADIAQQSVKKGGAWHTRPPHRAGSDGRSSRRAMELPTRGTSGPPRRTASSPTWHHRLSHHPALSFPVQGDPWAAAQALVLGDGSRGVQTGLCSHVGCSRS